MMNKRLTPVVLSGGSGSRMWPLSRSAHPKQFLPFLGDNSLFQRTLKRLQLLKGPTFSSPLIVSNMEHRHLVIEQLNESNIEVSAVILEPYPKNTAPALTVAAFHSLKQFKKHDYLLALPADHAVKNELAFKEAIELGLAVSSQESIVLFGIKPDRPHTGFGYIEVEKGPSSSSALSATSFKEKPNLQTAKKFFNQQNYFWNSGIFLMSISLYLSLIEEFDKALFKNCYKALKNSETKNNQIVLNAEHFSKVTSVSIDYLLMENVIDKGIDIKVIPLDVGWSDLGSWNSYWEFSDKDEDGNVSYGDVMNNSSKNSFLYSENTKLVTLGLKDSIVINTPDVVLVAHKDKTEEIKEIVEKIKKTNIEKVELPRKVSRPWGTYDSIDESDTFKVKRITVYPGHKLSKQFHHKRSETWVVVKGKATVTIGEETISLEKDESVYIPKGVHHRLENKELTPLELIEVQTGTYFGEDDIERIEDDYGRN